MSKLAAVLRMVKFEHSIFALPFALGGALLAANGMPPVSDLVLIVLAAVFARTTAMAFNRLVDRRYDATNPRTAQRELVSGGLAVGWTWGFTVCCATGFFACAYLLAPICGWLSLPVLVILCGYSLLKRFTVLCHFGLGIALACAPAGAWLAVSKGFLPGWELPLWIGGGVVLWVAGFDLLYSILDIEHDRKSGLHSLPARLGAERTRFVAAFLHLAAVLCWYYFGNLAELGGGYNLGLVLVGGLLLVEHLILLGRGLHRIPAAFFTVNAWIGPAWLSGLVFSLPPDSAILIG